MISIDFNINKIFIYNPMNEGAWDLLLYIFKLKKDQGIKEERGANILFHSTINIYSCSQKCETYTFLQYITIQFHPFPYICRYKSDECLFRLCAWCEERTIRGRLWWKFLKSPYNGSQSIDYVNKASSWTTTSTSFMSIPVRVKTLAYIFDFVYDNKVLYLKHTIHY